MVRTVRIDKRQPVILHCSTGATATGREGVCSLLIIGAHRQQSFGGCILHSSTTKAEERVGGYILSIYIHIYSASLSHPYPIKLVRRQHFHEQRRRDVRKRCLQMNHGVLDVPLLGFSVHICVLALHHSGRIASGEGGRSSYRARSLLACQQSRPVCERS